MFRRRVRRRTGEAASPQPPQPTLRARSTSELAMDVQHRSGGGPYNQGLSVSHDSVFTPDPSDHAHHAHHAHSHAAPPALTIATRGVNMAELKAALRHRRGDDSGSGDDDPGLPRSPPTSPTTLDVLNHGLKGSSRATQSSCSDGSLLSMGSSENDEDSLGAASHHSSRASLLEGRHQVVDHEPVVGAVRLSHQAALHKIAVRPRRTHGAPRARRATQIGGQISLPDVIEEANSRHLISGPRPAPPQAGPAPTTPTPAAPTTPTTSSPATPEDDEVMEDAVVAREQQHQQQGSGPESAGEQKEERRDEPLFQRLFGSSSKRSGRRQSRGSGEESRENSVSPLRRGTEQRTPRFPLLSGSSSKPRQEATSHPLPPSGRPREASRERGSREFPQPVHSPEDVPVPAGGPAASRGQGVRKTKSFREEQTAVQREALRRKVPPQPGAEGRGGPGPGKAARLSSSLENIDNDDTNKTPPPQPYISTASPPIAPTASPQRSSTESLSTTPIPGVFIRQHPQTSRHRGPTHPSPPENTSGPFSLDSSLPQHPREAEEHLRKASSVDQVSSDGLTPSTAAATQPPHLGHRDIVKDYHSKDLLSREQVHKEHHSREHHVKEQVMKEQHLIKEQHIKEHHSKEHYTREQVHKEQHIREQVVIKEQLLIREQQYQHQQYNEEQLREQHARHYHQQQQQQQQLTSTTVTNTTITSTPKATDTKPTAGPTPPTPAAKQSLLDSLVESIRPDRKHDTPKHTHRKSLTHTHPPQPQQMPQQTPPQPSPQTSQGLYKEEPLPAAPPSMQQEAGEGEQAAPRRPVRREASMKRIPSCEADSTGVPEFMRIQLNRVESKGQSVIYDTDHDRGDRRDTDVSSRRESVPCALSAPSVPSSDLTKDGPLPDWPADTHTPARKDSAGPSSAASTRDSLTRKPSMQASRGVLRDVSPSAAAPEGGGVNDAASEPPSQDSTVERVQLRRPGMAERTSHASSVSSTSTSSSSAAATTKDQPELFKVFARRSFKIKDVEKELSEASSMDEMGVEASSEVSEMTVSSVRPPSTSPGLSGSSTPPTEPAQGTQKIGINAISYNRKSVGNPALSFIPPPTSAPIEPPVGHSRSQAAPTTTSTTRSPSITTTSTTRSPSITATTTTTTITTSESTTATSTQQTVVYSKILSSRVSVGGEASSGNESEGSISSPVPTRPLATPQAKASVPGVSSRPGSALFWPPRPQVSQEDASPPVPVPQHTAPPQQATPPQEASRRAGEGVEEGVEVEVSPLDIGAARRRFMSASFPAVPAATLGTSPPAFTPSPATPTPSPPAPTPSPPAPAPAHPPACNIPLGITSSILSRVGSAGVGMAPTHSPSPTPTPAPTHTATPTPSFTVTVRTQSSPTLTSDTQAPPTSAVPAPVSDTGKGSDAGSGQQTTEDWRVLVRQRREGRLKQTKTPDSEEIIIETRPPVSRNSKVLEMASNFQKLQVA